MGCRELYAHIEELRDTQAINWQLRAELQSVRQHILMRNDRKVLQEDAASRTQPEIGGIRAASRVLTAMDANHPPSTADLNLLHALAPEARNLPPDELDWTGHPEGDSAAAKSESRARQSIALKTR